jgi:hypothetical protein
MWTRSGHRQWLNYHATEASGALLLTLHVRDFGGNEKSVLVGNESAAPSAISKFNLAINDFARLPGRDQLSY